MSKEQPILAPLALLDQWFAAPFGQQLLSAQQRLIDEALTRCFGYHLLQLSVLSDVVLFEACGVQRRYRCHPSAAGHDLNSEFFQLPFETESLDVVIIHHVHEYVQNPHQFLREIHRVVIPHGHVIIAGFNPWSPLGCYALGRRWWPQRWSAPTIWRNQRLSTRRLHDWLQLLDFRVSAERFAQHSPQLLNRVEAQWWQHVLQVVPLGNTYVISAIKQTANYIPAKPVWQSQVKPFAGLTPIKPRVSSSAVNNSQRENVR